MPEIAVTTVLLIRMVIENRAPTTEGRSDHVVSVVRAVRAHSDQSAPAACLGGGQRVGDKAGGAAGGVLGPVRKGHHGAAGSLRWSVNRSER